jgi:hypothetical protein
MRAIVGSIVSEYHRYKAIAEAAMGQLSEDELNKFGPGGGSSVAIIAWHLGGNLASRFTDFLTTDGEKPWRERDGEFARRSPKREELMQHWDRGWSALLDSLADLADADLGRTVTIRGTKLRVDEALHRSLAHTSYHVGQVVYLAKEWKGSDWKFLSIPPGQSKAYNKKPTLERPDKFTAALRDSFREE